MSAAPEEPAPRPPNHSQEGLTRGLRGAWEDASRLVSTLSQEVDWPWSGSVRKHVYMDFAVYIMLLIVFCCITLLPTTTRSSDSFNLVQSIQSTLVKEFRPEPEIAFDNINELSGLRRWIEGPFMAVFYGYNPNTPPDDPAFSEFKPLPNYIAGFYLASTTVLGPIRLRQLRVEANSCQVEDRWKTLVGSCHSAYTNSTAHITKTSTFNQMWANYSSIEEVDATMETSLRLSSLLGTAGRAPPEEVKAAKDVALKGFHFNESTAAGVYRGRLANFYWESGFVVDLPENNERAARTVLALLGATNWLDTQTRALFLEFSLYLAPSDLMLSARLVAEVHETGTIWTDMTLEPINLDVYRMSNRGQMALYIIGFIVVLIAVGWDMRSTWDLRHYQDRRTGAAIVWVVVGVMLYATILVASCLHVWNMAQASALNFRVGEYLPTHRLGYGVTVERGLWAMASFVVWFRLLKFTSQLPVLGILGRTIGRAVPQVFVFFLISFVIFLAFAQCFFMAYYASVDGYQSFQASIMSVLRFTVLSFDYDALSNENRLLTPFLFSLLLLIVFFIWVNVMVAIISEVYQQENEKSLNIQIDDDFNSMEPDMEQPQNDLKAMRYHTPVLAHSNLGHPELIRLTPDRFFRVRLADLDRFNALVTIDMQAHFAVLAEQARLKAERKALLAAQPPKGSPHKRATQYAVGEGTHAQHTDSESLDNAEIHLDEHLHEHPAAIPHATVGAGVAEGHVKQNKMSDSMSDLEQHKGIYARLGSLGPHRYAARAAHALNCDDSDDEFLDAPADNGIRRFFDSQSQQPMELQALYFDRGFHNPTSARMWWDKHKAFFDPREQLIQHALQQSRKAVAKLGKRIKSSGSKTYRGTSARAPPPPNHNRKS